MIKLTMERSNFSLEITFVWGGAITQGAAWTEDTRVLLRNQAGFPKYLNCCQLSLYSPSLVVGLGLETREGATKRASDHTYTHERDKQTNTDTNRQTDRQTDR